MKSDSLCTYKPSTNFPVEILHVQRNLKKDTPPYWMNDLRSPILTLTL